MKVQTTSDNLFNKENNFLHSAFVTIIIFTSVLIACFIKSHLSELDQSIAMIRRELNNTGNAEEQDLLIFNRVPKVGSQTLMSLFTILSHRNNFTAYKDDGDNVRLQGETTMLFGEIERAIFMDLFSFLSLPASYSKHISFIDFEEHQKVAKTLQLKNIIGKTDYKFRNPIYVNMVREPVNRIVSWYYYVRAPWYIVGPTDDGTIELSKPEIGPRFYKQSYEDCVLSSNRECRYIEGENVWAVKDAGDHISQIMFFCGHKEHCAKLNDEQAYKDAIRNVEKHYAVVGVLEDFAKSMEVFERYVPKFFRGAPAIYAKMNSVWGSMNKNIYQPKVDEKIKDLVRRNMTREVDFYQFCRQRLHRQYLAMQN